LFTAIVERIARQHFQKAWMNPPSSSEPAERLRQLAPNSLAPENTDPTQMNFYRLIVAESGRFPHLAEFYVRQFEKTSLETVTEYLRNCTTLRLSDPEATAWIVTGTLTFYYLVMEVLHGKTVLTMSSDRLLEALIQLLLPQPSPENPTPTANSDKSPDSPQSPAS
jgi:hypothetical protein